MPALKAPFGLNAEDTRPVRWNLDAKNISLSAEQLTSLQ